MSLKIQGRERDYEEARVFRIGSNVSHRELIAASKMEPGSIKSPSSEARTKDIEVAERIADLFRA